MAQNGSGLQSDRFKESFSKRASEDPDITYTTEDFVKKTIRNHVNPVSEVTINTGNGVSFGTNTDSTITVNLDASLESLNNVNLGVVQNGYYLQYDSASQKWSAGVGLCPGGLDITDLNNVTNAPSNNTILFSPNGANYTFKEDRSVSIDNITALAGNGIFISKNTTSYPYEADIRTNFIDFPDTNSDSDSDYYLVTDSLGITRKILKSNIDITGFNGFEPETTSLIFRGLSAGNVNGTSLGPLKYDNNGKYTFDSTGYLTNVNGTLPISQGGTSSSTKEDARKNLELDYNPNPGGKLGYNILGANSPEYEGTMIGDSLRLVGNHEIGVGDQGSGHSQSKGTKHYYIPVNGIKIYLTITVAIDGGIANVALTNPEEARLHLFKEETYQIFYDDDSLGNAVSTGGSVEVSGSPSYINYGKDTGESGYGIKFEEEKVPQVKNGSVWEPINKEIKIENLTNVSTNSSGSFNSQDFLIYDGTSFIPYQLQGKVTMDSNKETQINTNGLCISQMYFGVETPTTTDFQHIIGTGSSIQGQLNDRLKHNGDPFTTGNRLIVAEPYITGGQPTTSQLSFNNEPDIVDRPQIPVINPPSLDTVSFENVYSGFPVNSISSSTISISDLQVPVLNKSIETGEKIDLDDFISLFPASGPSGGIVSSGDNNQLVLNIESLQDYPSDKKDSDNSQNYIAVGPHTQGTTTPNQKITIQDLLKVPSFPTFSAASSYHTEGALALFPNSSGLSLGVGANASGQWYTINLNGPYS